MCLMTTCSRMKVGEYFSPTLNEFSKIERNMKMDQLTFGGGWKGVEFSFEHSVFEVWVRYS